MRALLAAAALVMATPAAAEAVTVMGAGGMSCGHWTTSRRSPVAPEKMMVVSWVQGFLTSLALTTNRDLAGGRDFDALLGWVDNYCLAHPLESIADATVALADELATKPR